MTKLIRALLAAGVLALLATPAFSQWQVTSGSVPLGRGPGVVGFNSVAPASGMTTWWATPSSANLRAALTDEVGTGVAYFVNGALGTPASATLTNATGLPISTGVSGLGTGVATWLATPSSENLATAVTNETGSGALVFGTAPQISTIELGNASDTTLARVSAGLVSVEGVTVLTVATGQPLDADLTTIAGLTATTDNILQSVSSAWASRTPAQVTATLPACVGDAGSGGTKGLVPAPVSGDSTKFLRGDCTFVSIPGGGDALTSGNLSQFAATTSLQFAGVISDETGSGKVVLDTAPQISTIELGAASDTTLSRTGAGAVAVEGVGVALNSTSLAHTAGTLELGAASDTTLARSGAGDITVEGNGVYRAGGTDVPVADGGTGASSLTANNVLLGNGTSAVQVVAPGTSGNVLTSNGTTWTSAAPAGGGGWTLITSQQPTSDVASVSFTGLSGYRLIKIVFVIQLNSGASATLSISGRVGGGTYRDMGVIHKTDSSAQIHVLQGNIEISNVASATDTFKVVSGTIGSYPTTVIDNTSAVTGADATLGANGANVVAAWASYQETWDDIKLTGSTNFEGSTAGQRGYFYVYGMV